jgi:Arc/MetJ-type ribon-helix-helix transcriptional regulator
MAADLSPETESFIQQQISLGVYPDRKHALEEGIALLRERDGLRRRLVESRRQLDAGEYVEFDDEGRNEFFEGLKERARKRSEMK